MDSAKYGKERGIRGKYRRRGRRRTYIQRRIYERAVVQVEERVNLTNSEAVLSIYDEEDFVTSTLSTSVGRSRFFTQRRGVRLRWRRRGPGRFPHELRKRHSWMRRGLSVGIRRSWKWYESEVDVNRTDRRRSRSFFIPLFWMRFRIGKNSLDSISRSLVMEDRKLRVWGGLVRYRLRLSERTDFSQRRSRRRRRRGYTLCREASRRRIYRRKGRRIRLE